MYTRTGLWNWAWGISGATEGSCPILDRPLTQAGSAHSHDHTPAGPPASPAVDEFSLSAASASLPVSSDPFWMSPGEPSASVQKPHICREKVLRRLWQKRAPGRARSFLLSQHIPSLTRATISEFPRTQNEYSLQDTHLRHLCLLPGHLLRAAKTDIKMWTPNSRSVLSYLSKEWRE